MSKVLDGYAVIIEDEYADPNSVRFDVGTEDEAISIIRFALQHDKCITAFRTFCEGEDNGN